MNTRKWAESITQRSALIIGVVHLFALFLGVVAGQGWFDLDVVSLLVGYAALVAAVLTIIRKPLLNPPPVTLPMVILTVVTPALVGVTAHGIVRAITLEQSRVVEVKWLPDERLDPGDAGARADISLPDGYTRLAVRMSYEDPASSAGSCPHVGVKIRLNDQQPLQGKTIFRSEESAEFSLSGSPGRARLSVWLDSTHDSVPLDSMQNCSVVVRTQAVTFHR